MFSCEEDQIIMITGSIPLFRAALLFKNLNVKYLVRYQSTNNLIYNA